MANMLPGDSSHHGMVENSPCRGSHDNIDEAGRLGSSWYFSRKDIEENSPSRRDGIDLKKETYLRKSYCTYLQDLGMRLKVPQVTIATAIVFCHRFFLRQSHAKNDRRIIATVCMFLAGKVEETPRPLKDVILVSYETIHKKDPAAVQRIKQREVYEQQKELILLGERVVLTTLGFDLNVHHPYKPLVEAIKKFKVAQNALAQVAWNFVNDGLRTSLCLQFMPHHIAAGAIFLAAKFLKVKLPSDGEKVWWQEFEVTPRQLEEVSNQMLELYEQNRAAQQPNGNEMEGNFSNLPNQRAGCKGSSALDEQAAHGQQHFTKESSLPPSAPPNEQQHSDRQNGMQRTLQTESRNDVPDASTHGNLNLKSGFAPDQFVNDYTVHTAGKPNNDADGPDSSSSMAAAKKIDRDKVKAALEKRRKVRADVNKRVGSVDDDDDLIERELESGVELAAEGERVRQVKGEARSHSYESQDNRHVADNGIRWKEKASENAEEGEIAVNHQDYHSPDPMSRKRKAASPGTEPKDSHDRDAQHHQHTLKHHEWSR